MKYAVRIALVLLGLVMMSHSRAVTLDTYSSPNGAVIIHYVRPGGDYIDGKKFYGPTSASAVDFAGCTLKTCWGLEQSLGSSKKVIFPSGMDGYGAYYVLENTTSAESKPAYIKLRRETASDACGHVLEVDPSKGANVFLVSNVCSVFYTPDEAIQAIAPVE